jgi:hypothetical protein
MLQVDKTDQSALDDSLLLLALVVDLCEDGLLSGAHDVDRQFQLHVEIREPLLGAVVVDVVVALALEPWVKVGKKPRVKVMITIITIFVEKRIVIVGCILKLLL